MFNFKKVRKLGVKENGKYEADKKGMNEKQKKDQEKYEEKVNDFLECCKKFNNTLIEENSKSETLTGESIKGTFENIIGGYFKTSKKLSMFSNAKRVYQGMLKELKKYKKLELNDEKNAKAISGAFLYKKSKTNEKEGYVNRSVVDDDTVYNFFHATIRKTLIKIAKSAKEDLKETEKLMDFIAKVQDDMNDFNAEIKELAGTAKENAEQLVDLQKDAKEAQKANPASKNDMIKTIFEAKKQHKNSTRDEKRIEAFKIEISTFDKELEALANELESGVSDDRKKAINARVEEIKTKKDKVQKKINELGEKVKKVGEAVKGLEVQVEEAGNPPETSFKIENHKLIVHSQKAFDEFRETTRNNLVYYNKAEEGIDKVIKSLDLSGVSDISGKNSLDQGAFGELLRLSTVTAKDLKILGDDGAFLYCESLTKFNEKGNYGYNIEGIDTIGESAFESCGKSGFKANVSAKTIGLHAFQSSGLTEINLPNATTIKWMAFGLCDRLTEITLGQEEVEITRNAIPNEDRITIVLACKNEEKRKQLAEQIRTKFSNVKIKDSSGNELLPPKAEANQPEQQAATEKANT